MIYHSNISELTIKFYLIDLEIYYSREIRSYQTIQMILALFNQILQLAVENQKKGVDSIYSFDIPKEFIFKNLFIEVSSESKKVFETYFSADIQVFISENLGELKVCDSKNVSLRKTYVKCFYKANQDIKFYKDGYTDLRRLFNYLELNTDQLKNIEQFSILISHDENGSIIKQCKPPYNIRREIQSNKNHQMDEIETVQNYKQEQRKQWRFANK